MQLPENEVDKIYSQVDLATRLGGQYQFLSPNEIAEALKDQSGMRDSASISRIAAERNQRENTC